MDTFFRSIADELGSRAVGVVLSGMGTDGMLGAEYLRDRGGLVVAQDPATAQFDSMPRAVVEAGAADIVAAPEQLTDRVLWYLKHGVGRRIRDAAEQSLDEGRVFEKIIAILREHGGNDFGLYTRNTLRRRVERRMAIHQIDKPATYLRFLQRNPGEVALLFKEMLIGVTSFFRDPDAWQTLGEEVLPALIRGLPEGGTLRAWVPACSTGEEAYSLAILFREVLSTLNPKHPVTLQVFATDLNAEAIAVARLGTYSANLESAVSAERRQRFFARERGGYRIHKDVRAMVTFATHNVTTDPPFTRLDLICCRNLLIYLNQDVQKRLMPVSTTRCAPVACCSSGAPSRRAMPPRCSACSTPRRGCIAGSRPGARRRRGSWRCASRRCRRPARTSHRRHGAPRCTAPPASSCSAPWGRRRCSSMPTARLSGSVAARATMPRLIGGRYGLSSKEFTPAMVRGSKVRVTVRIVGCGVVRGKRAP